MSDKTYVWDPIIRVFHWSILILFVTSYLTGESEHWLHIYSGYGIIILILTRFIWGFFGGHYARFSSFIKTPKTIIQYLFSIFKGNPKRFLGHNPAGGAMIILLMITLVTTTFSGLKLYAIEHQEGPFATQYLSLDKMQLELQENLWEDIHEGCISFMWVLISLHLLGVFISSLQHKENLVLAMITGFKNTKNPKGDK